jgi:hypothetical protein
MKTKPPKYDINVYCTHKIKEYTGRNQDKTRENYQGVRVVHELVSPLLSTAKGSATDNFSTSCQLAEYLLAQNLTLNGFL